MTVNWHEFGDFCRMADDLGIDATVNAVSQPDHLSLYRASVADLTEVVERLGAQDAALSASLGQNRETWSAELVKLRHHLRDERARVAREPDEAVGIHVSVDARPRPRGTAEAAPVVDVAAIDATIESLRTEYLDHGAPRVDLDDRGQISWVDPGGVLTIGPEALLGRHHEEIRGVVSTTLGAVVDVANHQLGRGAEVSAVRLADGRVLEVLATPIVPGSRAEGVSLLFRWGDPVATEVT
jgi:hypothetical protein